VYRKPVKAGLVAHNPVRQALLFAFSENHP